MTNDNNYSKHSNSTTITGETTNISPKQNVSLDAYDNVSLYNHHQAAIPSKMIPPVASAALNFISYLFGFGDDAPIEATGLSVDIFARATIGMSSMFLGPALIELASEAAGCPKYEHDDNFDNNNVDGNLYDAINQECNLRIHGFHPSSLLTNIAVVSGLLGCITLPVFGSIVDHTKYRRHVGAYTAALLTVIKAVEISIGPRTWILIAILQVFASFLFNFHLTAAYAYVTELSTDPSRQSSYNSSFYVTMYTSTLIFLLSVIGISVSLQLSDVGTAVTSQIVTSVTCLIFFTIAWKYLFRDRPPLSIVPDNLNLMTCGFQKVSRTFRSIVAENPPLKWLMLSVTFAEAGSTALITVSTTYMKVYLAMSAKEISIVFLTVLFFGIPGSLIGNFITRKFRNPIPSVMICDFVFIISTILATLILTGPTHKNKAVIFGIIWGICLGWLHPQHTTAFASIIPRGQEAELMGMYLLCGQLFAWLPPMVFTLLNEMGYPMTYGLASLAMFFIAGIFCILMMSRHNLPICSSMSDSSHNDDSSFDMPTVDASRRTHVSEAQYLQLSMANIDRKRSDSPESTIV